MKTKENGITLMVLVITIVLLLILASIGFTIGKSTIDSASFTQFKNELKVMQDKVNGLNQENKTDIRQELTDDQKNILNTTEISNIIYNGKTDEEKTKIQNGFRYISKNYINTELNLDSIERDYLINVEYRYVIFPDGFEYEGTKYYMIDQIEGEIYNVRYNDKNEKQGNFDVVVTKEKNRCKVEISNIQYNGYVDKWQVKYKLEGNSYWETSDDLTFYIKKEGMYTINVVHGDEIDLGTKSVKILYDGLITDKIYTKTIKIGDYIQYTPDTADTTDILSEISAYSGNTDATKNTTDKLTQESLNWRVLDIKDGKARLISELPTTSKINLEGYNGYNNAVYLLDKTCKTLYSKTGYSENVQDLKIEDIQDKMTTDYTTVFPDYGTTYTLSKRTYYPSIVAQEEKQTVDGTTGTFGVSEQTIPVNQTTSQEATSLTIKNTVWAKLMAESDFTDSIYYNLFIKNGTNDNYANYFLSSRGITAYPETDTSDAHACFYVYFSGSGIVSAVFSYISSDEPRSNELTFRPVITLNTDVEIDTTDETKDGSKVENAWILKSK